MKEVMHISQLDRMLEVFDDETSALASSEARSERQRSMVADTPDSAVPGSSCRSGVMAAVPGLDRRRDRRARARVDSAGKGRGAVASHEVAPGVNAGEAARRGAGGDGLGAGRDVLDGGQRPLHHRRRPAPPGPGRRLLDGPDRGHQRAVRGVRQGDRVRDRGRAQARPEGLSRRRRPRSSSPARPSSPPRRRPCRWTTRSAWWRYVPGADWRHPEGPGSSIDGQGRLPGRPRLLRRRPGVRRSGPASGCRPRPSGSSRRGAGSTARSTPGATSVSPRASPG